MDFRQTREMVRLRHELRRLLADGRRREAAPLLEQLRELAAHDERERHEVTPELRRWEASLLP